MNRRILSQIADGYDGRQSSHHREAHQDQQSHDKSQDMSPSLQLEGNRLQDGPREEMRLSTDNVRLLQTVATALENNECLAVLDRESYNKLKAIKAYLDKREPNRVD